MKVRILHFIFAFFLSLLASLNVAGQTDGMSYQAIIIDNNPQEIPGLDIIGNYLSEGEITLKFSIINAEGITEYQEIQNTITDKVGMVSLQIGQGEVTEESNGLWIQIEWDGTPKQLIVDISYAGDPFQPLSIQELLFVPYAYHRKITATETLDVDGATTLNNTLTVTNESLTYLTGGLDVDGVTNLGNALNVLNQSPTYLSGDLTVDGNTNIGGDFSVLNGSNSNFTGPVNIDGATTINNTLDVSGDTNIGGDLSVLNGSATYLTGPLTVDGPSVFNTITVLNESFLNGNVEVDGIANFNNTLNVNNGFSANFSGNVNVDGKLDVYGFTTLHNNFYVEEGSPSYLSGTLTVEEPLTVNAESNLNGRVVISADINGDQLDPGAYPLEVKDSNQGILIRLDGSETVNHNFLLFVDGNNIARGCIEGQSSSEMHNSFRYIWDAAFQAIGVVFYAAEAISCVANFPPDAAEAVTNTTAAGVAIVQTTEWFIQQELEQGVSFTSGGADYAEYLMRTEGLRPLTAGEVVGIKNGKVTLTTAGADHVMAVSTNPIVTGNLPEAGKESLYEKIAFLGQTPVRVVGAVKEGDYIVASGSHDGMARAIAPADMKTLDYLQMLGIAWESNASVFAKHVNVGVGMHQNKLANRVSEMELRLAKLEQWVENLTSGTPVEGDLQAQNIGSGGTAAKADAITQKKFTKMTVAEFEAWLKEKEAPLNATMSQLGAELKKRNIDYTSVAELVLLIDHPVEAVRQMYEGTFFASVWEDYERNRAGQMLPVEKTKR